MNAQTPLEHYVHMSNSFGSLSVADNMDFIGVPVMTVEIARGNAAVQALLRRWDNWYEDRGLGRPCETERKS